MRLLGAGLALGLILTAGCGEAMGNPETSTGEADADPTDTANEPEDPEVFTVQESQVTLVDETRDTPRTDGAPGRTGRELVTWLYEPEGEGPFPLIVFAHGLNGHPRKFTRLHRAWSAAGYVVAAPTFPLSNDEAPGGGDLADLGEQPGDMSFALDRLIAPDSPLTAVVDATRVGAGGLSLGGATVYGMVFDDCCRDERVGAAMVLDGNQLNFAADLTSGPPLLLVHADPDPQLPYENAVENYAAATVPSGFLTLHEQAHAEPYEDVVDPADELVEAVTIAWWDRWLGGDASADDRIVAAVAAADGLATWEHRAG